MKMKSKRTAKVAVAAAVVLGASTIGYAAGLFNLGDAGIGTQKVMDPESGQDYDADMISLQGQSDSPEYKACKEWAEFEEMYDADGAILAKVGNNSAGYGQYEEIYNCYTQEMVDKVDEICEKYHLSMLSNLRIAKNHKKLCQNLGIKRVYKTNTKGVKHITADSHFYANGTFGMDGTAILNGKEDNEIDYQISRSVKGFFDTALLNVKNLDSYKQWEYTTKSGKTARLAKSDSKALIMVELDKSFIVVNVLGNILKNTFEVSNEDLELLTESFDFAEIG